MKKYLMTGMAALAICAAFTSCSKDTDVYNSGVIENNDKQSIINNYNEAFKAYVGVDIASNQNWGFGSYAKANTRAANTEHNQWAAVDNKYKLLVPPALTPGQIQRVKVYFQYNRYLTYEDPHLTDFFVQQVYKGSTNPGTLSSEVYTSGNGASVKAGDHMDKLTVGEKETHVNDFNKADCGESTVLNNGTKQNDYVPDGTTHQDKITLMLGESTECVGFWCSEGSVQHNDCCALAGADVIDAWATSDEVKAWAQENNIDLGETVVDEWDRSFVGLDYEQVPASDAFATVAWNDPTPSFVKVDEIQPNYIWDSATNTILSKADYKAQYNTEYLLDKDGNKIPWLISDTNRFLADPSNFPSQDSYMPRIEIRTGYTDQVLDIQKIYAKVADNCYPVSSKQLQEWMKNVGGRDYIFSDWIVTLTPAKKFQIEDPYDIRIIAEDLNATKKEGDSEDSDFDFNDVVFDVKFLTDNTAKIRLVCAGGTLPIRLNGDPNLEVHQLFGISDTGKMINTGAEAKFPNQAATVTELPVFEIECPGVRESYGKNIEIEVQKIINGDPTWIKLDATAGQPAAKMGVMPDFTPCTERQSIKTRYTRFVEWVNTTEPDYWWRTTNE